MDFFFFINQVKKKTPIHIIIEISELETQHKHKGKAKQENRLTASAFLSFFEAKHSGNK